MDGRPQGQVRIWRREGKAGSAAGGERVRWAYAAFVSGDDLEPIWAALIEANGDRSAVLGWLQDLPAQCVLSGGEVREMMHRDPGLRRALRDARQVLRDEGKAGLRRISAEEEA